MYTAIRKSLDNRNRDDKGFTLIELLVVIIIIGILAAIAIPIFLSQRKKGFEASQKSDARSIATQMETFYTDIQVYPTAITQVVDTQRLDFTTEDYVVLSPNNSAQVMVATAAGGGFCVLVASDNTEKLAVYNSEDGGLKPMVAADAATPCGGGFGSNIVAAPAA